jgi:hypothetical protein
VDGEGSRLSGLVQVSDKTIQRGAVVVCKWTDGLTMDCPDVCLETS